MGQIHFLPPPSPASPPSPPCAATHIQMCFIMFSAKARMVHHEGGVRGSGWRRGGGADIHLRWRHPFHPLCSLPLLFMYQSERLQAAEGSAHQLRGQKFGVNPVCSFVKTWRPDLIKSIHQSKGGFWSDTKIHLNRLYTLGANSSGGKCTWFECWFIGLKMSRLFTLANVHQKDGMSGSEFLDQHLELILAFITF